MHAKDRWPQALQALLAVNSFKLYLNAFNNCIAKMEVGCLKYPGASTIGSQPLDWSNAPMTGTTAQKHNPAMSPHTKLKGPPSHGTKARRRGSWLGDAQAQALERMCMLPPLIRYLLLKQPPRNFQNWFHRGSNLELICITGPPAHGLDKVIWNAALRSCRSGPNAKTVAWKLPRDSRPL